MKKRKLLEKVIAGSKNVHFAEVTALAEAFGFRLDRISGSHHIFYSSRYSRFVEFAKRHGQGETLSIKTTSELD